MKDPPTNLDFLIFIPVLTWLTLSAYISADIHIGYLSRWLQNEYSECVDEYARLHRTISLKGWHWDNSRTVKRFYQSGSASIRYYFVAFIFALANVLVVIKILRSGYESNLLAFYFGILGVLIPLVFVPLITTEVKNDTLYIRSSKEYDPQNKLQIIVSTPDLKRFVFAGAGEANLSNVKNDRVEIVLSGAGSLTASGETKEADITLSGAGSVDAKNLHAINAKVNSTGVGSVDIYATGQLDAKASGIGEINYYGSPKIVNRQAGGSGK